MIADSLFLGLIGVCWSIFTFMRAKMLRDTIFIQAVLKFSNFDLMIVV